MNKKQITKLSKKLVSYKYNSFKLLAENDLDLIGEGNDRIAVEIRNKCFKIPKKERGIIQNQNEVDTWKNEGLIKPILMPVIGYDSDYLWISMPIGEQSTSEKDLSEIVDYLKKKNYNKSDITSENIVKYQGEIKICDYGFLQVNK